MVTLTDNFTLMSPFREAPTRGSEANSGHAITSTVKVSSTAVTVLS
jgi:hypothetical protein